MLPSRFAVIIIIAAVFLPVITEQKLALHHYQTDLGLACRPGLNCSVEHSRCYGGVCHCEPYFVAFNGTECLEGALLTDNCRLTEQCTVKVGNSTCNTSTHKCDCKPGYLKFRRHTCLPGALEGDVCYNDAHCQLTNNNTICAFTIPNLIGICRMEEKRNNTKLNEYPMVEDVFNRPGSLYRDEFEDVLFTAPTSSFTHTAYSVLDKLTGKQRYHGEELAASLGQPCDKSEQCQFADKFSECVDGFCECKIRNQDCNRNNTGCHPETFQCRNSRTCISWFFVCDGHRNCPDGSDEECSGPKCPSLSYQCANRGLCLSRAVICDGKKDCPNGEDESDCAPDNSTHFKTSCPEHSHQCDNGQCVPLYEFCNAITACDDGSDEPYGVCRSHGNFNSSVCPFRCSNGRCRSTAIVCTGSDGCGDHSDEDHCSVCHCPAVPTTTP